MGGAYTAPYYICFSTSGGRRRSSADCDGVFVGLVEVPEVHGEPMAHDRDIVPHIHIGSAVWAGLSREEHPAGEVVVNSGGIWSFRFPFD